MNKELLKKSVEKFLNNVILKGKDLEYTMEFSDNVWLDDTIEVVVHVVLDYLKLATDSRYESLIDNLESEIDSVNKYLGLEDGKVFPFFTWSYKNYQPLLDEIDNVEEDFEKYFSKLYPDENYRDYGFYLSLKTPEEGSPDFGIYFGSEEDYDHLDEVDDLITKLISDEKLLGDLVDKYSIEYPNEF